MTKEKPIYKPLGYKKKVSFVWVLEGDGGRDICPRCKFGILNYLAPERSNITKHICDRCKAVFSSKKVKQ